MYEYSSLSENFVNKTGQTIKLFSVKKENGFTKDRELFLKVHPGFLTQKLPKWGTGNIYFEGFFGDLRKCVCDPVYPVFIAYRNRIDRIASRRLLSINNLQFVKYF